MVRYDTEIRRPEDILFRSSRPQRNSTHVPRTRDWRYATGVFRHEDIADARNESTIWDLLDRDFNVRKAGRKRMNDERGEKESGVYKEGFWSHENEEGEEDGKCENEGTMDTPSPRKKMKSSSGSPEQGMPKKGSRSTSIALFKYTGNTNEETGEREYKQTGLIVRLKCVGKTPIHTPKMPATPSVTTPRNMSRAPTPTMGFRASGAPPTPPSTVKSVSMEWSKEPASTAYTDWSTRRDSSDASYIKINTSDETVTANVVFPIRDIFTFPLLAMIGMAGEGVKMGLENASRREKVGAEEVARKAKLEKEQENVTLVATVGRQYPRISTAEVALHCGATSSSRGGSSRGIQKPRGRDQRGRPDLYGRR